MFENTIFKEHYYIGGVPILVKPAY